MQRTKAWNSTLHNISKKRQAMGVKGLKRTPLRKINPETDKKWRETRRDVLRIYGCKCFLCGRTDLPICIHHWNQTRTQAPARKYDLTNLVPLCSKCHNHQGYDEKFKALKVAIERKMKGGRDVKKTPTTLLGHLLGNGCIFNKK